MLKWYFNFMPMNSIPWFFYEIHHFWKTMQLTMRRTAPNIKSSVQKYQSSVNKERTCFR